MPLLCAGLRQSPTQVSISLSFFSLSHTHMNTLTDIHPAGEQVGDLRLYGDTGDGQGAVEIFTTFGWSSICPDGFDSSDAVVICQQFGYDTGSVANIE